MFELLLFDGRKRIRESFYLALGLSVLAAFVIWAYPSFSGAFEDTDALLDAYPDGVIQLFDVRTMSTLEGFLAFELYVFGWILLFGLYLAYSAAGVIAGDVEDGRADTLLAMPLSRSRLLAERFGALGLPILAVNLVVPVVVLAGSWLIDDPLSVVDVYAVHVLSIPYLFACGGIGILCSVVFDRAGVAQRVALAGTFGLYLAESLLEGTDFQPLGALSPTRYYDPNAILLDGSYNLLAATALVGMTVLLVAGSQLLFTRRDI
jgi:ABC-2 type transport system permease protein